MLQFLFVVNANAQKLAITLPVSAWPLINVKAKFCA